MMAKPLLVAEIAIIATMDKLKNKLTKNKLKTTIIKSSMKRHPGKTGIIRDMLRQNPNLKSYVIFCDDYDSFSEPEPEPDPVEQNKYPLAFIKNEYNEEIIAKILKKQQDILSQKNKDEKVTQVTKT
jgi:hypothetical protein